MRPWSVWFTFLIVILITNTLASGGVVLEQTPGSTGAVRVMFVAQGPDATLVDVATGHQVDPPSLVDSTAGVGGTITWQVARDSEDRLGNRHAVYRQRYVPPDGVLRRLFPNGIRMRGGELGFHYDTNGTLTAVLGAFFSDIESVGTIGFGSLEEARTSAREALAIAGYELPTDLQLPAAVLRRLLLHSEVEFASNGSGRGFQPVWVLPFVTSESGGVWAALSGETGDLLAHWNRSPSYDCEPSSFVNLPAKGVPQNQTGWEGQPFDPNIAPRDLWATEIVGQKIVPGGSSFSYHGHRAGDGGIPDIQVFQGSYHRCNDDGTLLFAELVRLNASTDSHCEGLPCYVDSASPDVPGSSAGDALWKTYQTMQVFDWLGFYGFDDMGTTAKITVGAVGAPDFAAFNLDHNENRGWYNGVFISQKDNLDFELSSCLDVIAHEWGHGTIYERVSEWDYGVWQEAVFHEAWADVISYIVEWFAEPEWQSGDPLVERADWKSGEDRRSDGSDPGRWVDVDDGDPDPSGCCGGYLSFHAQDPTGPYPDHPAWEGNRLSVALYLTSEGGQNPVCANNWLSGCEIVVTPIDIAVAGPAFFRALTVYVNGSHGWDDFADLVKIAAKDLYTQSWPGHCQDALFEQQSIGEAFTAIGHPGSGNFYCVCVTEPGCNPDPD